MNGTPLVGRKFGVLAVTKLLSNSKVRVYCRGCGQTKIRDKRGIYRTKSCGCLQFNGIGHIQHGAKRAGKRTPEYVCWVNLRERCYNPLREDYPRYGGRNITVCPRWRKSFTAFLEDMGPKPNPTYSIDRVKNNKGYSKSNCRWSDPHTQRMNQRRMQKAA
jgi:hypothetical protein